MSTSSVQEGCKKVVQEGLAQIRAGTARLKPENLLASQGLDADDVRLLADELKRNTTLISLSLPQNSIGEIGASLVAEALVSNGALTALNLYRNGIGDAGAVSIARMLSVNRSLTAVNLRYNEIGDLGASALGEALKENATLASMNLRDNEVGDAGATAIACALEVNSSLAKLDLYNNAIRDAGVSRIVQALRDNPALTNLDLENNSASVESASSLAKTLAVNVTLTSLNLYNNNLGAEGASLIADALKVNTVLKRLNLRRNKLGPVGASHLAEALKDNTTLTCLNLNGNNLRDAGASAAAAALGVNASLKSLDLECNSVTNTFASSLAKALMSNRSLAILNLRKNKIGPAGATLIAGALRENTTVLSKIVLDGNLFGDAGATAIAEALETNTSLTDLNLRCNKMGAAGASALARALESNASLKSLNLDNNSIGAGGALALAAALAENSTLSTLRVGLNRIEDPDDATDATCILAGLLTPNIVTLDVRDNRLTRIPGTALLRCPDFDPVDEFGGSIKNPFEFNPIDSPPEEITRKGLRAVRDFFKKLADEGGSQTCGVAKMMFVGLGEAGKTSLLEAIRNERTNMSAEIARDSRTVGIDVKTWRPSTASLEDALDGAARCAADSFFSGLGGALEVNACDFAGQSEYGVTHQLFLTPRSFFVLVWDATKVDPSAGVANDLVDRWLDTIQARAPRAQVLMVATHCSAFKDDPGALDSGCRLMATHVAERVERMRRAAMEEVERHIRAVARGDEPRRDTRQGEREELLRRGESVPDDDQPYSLIEKMELRKVAARDGAPHIVGALRSFAAFGFGASSSSLRPGRERTGGAGPAEPSPSTADPRVAALIDEFTAAIVRVDSLDGTGVAKARRDILRCISAMPEVRLELPPSWIAIKAHLASLRSPSVVHVTVEEAHASFKRRGGTGGAGHPALPDFVDATRFWHRVGEVFLFRSGNGSTLLFPDPARVFDIVRTVVRHIEEHNKAPPRDDGELDEDFVRLIDDRVLTRKLLVEHLWRKGGPIGNSAPADDHQRRALVELLEFLGVIVPSPEGTGDGLWFVPSLVTDAGRQPPLHPQVFDEARGVLVRRFAFPMLPFAFLHRIHSELKLVEENLGVHLGYSRGFLRSRSKGKEDSQAVYRREAGADVFAPEQFDLGDVGRAHVATVSETRDVITVESNDAALLEVVAGYVKRAAAMFAGLRGSEWVETPFPSERDPRRKLCVRVTNKVRGMLRTATHASLELPCVGTFDATELRSSQPPDVFISYQWGAFRDGAFANMPLVDALQVGIESRLHRRCWRDKERMVEGRDVKLAMTAGVRECPVFLFCLTADYVHSPNCVLEFRTAKDLGKPMVLVMLEVGGLPTHAVLEVPDKWAAWRESRLASHPKEVWSEEHRKLLAEMVQIFYVDRCGWGSSGQRVDSFDPVARTWNPDFIRSLGKAISNAIPPSRIKAKNRPAPLAAESPGAAVPATHEPKTHRAPPPLEEKDEDGGELGEGEDEEQEQGQEEEEREEKGEKKGEKNGEEEEEKEGEEANGKKIGTAVGFPPQQSMAQVAGLGVVFAFLLGFYLGRKI